MEIKKRKLSLKRVEAAAREENGKGFCLSCGSGQYGVEPDACKYKCDNCGKDRVYGAEEICLLYSW